MAAASGKAATRYDRIAEAAGELVRAGGLPAELKATYIDQTERLTNRLQVADTALAGIADIADRARTLLVQRLDGNLGDAVPLDSEIDAMLQEVEAALNTRLDRQYLFAGSRTDTPR